MAVLNALPLVQTVPGHHEVNLLIHGPCINVDLSLPPAPATTQQGVAASAPLIESGLALIDTGASGSVIDDAVAKRLGLIATGTTPASGVSGPYTATQYAVGWRLSGNPNFDAIPVTDGPLFANQGIIMLLGRDILAGCVLIYNGTTGSFTLTW